MKGCDYMEDGVWRTIAGRRVFIKKGQSLTEAMRESGKFKEGKKEDTFESETFSELKEYMENVDKELEKYKKEYGHLPLGERTDEMYKNVQDAKNKMFEKLEQKINDHDFYSKELEEKAKNKFSGDLLYKMAVIDLDNVARKEKLEISSSPYSLSTYAFKPGEEIGWGQKPKNSYRISNHWGWVSDGDMHCELTNQDKSKFNPVVNKTLLAKYNGETYDIIFDYTK